MTSLLLEEQEALEKFRAAGHEPKLDEQGQPDPMAFDIDNLEGFGGHNGFSCAKKGCYGVICVWCAMDDRYKCEPCDDV